MRDDSHQSESEPRRMHPVDAAGLFARGLAMGTADIIPGVSGGTIALVSGIYERFILALRSLSLSFLAPLARGNVRQASREFFGIHWEVLIPLGLGILIAIVTMSRVIPPLMEKHPGAMYAFFFGLILASSWIPFARMKRRRAEHYLALIVAAGAAFWFVGIQPQGLQLRIAHAPEGAVAAAYSGKIRHSADVDAIQSMVGELPAVAGGYTVVLFDPKGEIHDDIEAKSVGVARVDIVRDEGAFAAALVSQPTVILAERRASLGWIFVCGVIVISAMILPGLSGAFLMLFLGQYHAMLSAIKSVVDHLLVFVGREPDPLVLAAGEPAMGDFLFVGVFQFGVLVGLVLFSRIVGWLLEHRHDVTMAALTGMMLGALRQPASVVLTEGKSATSAGSYWLVVGVVALVGGALVIGLTIADTRLRAADVLSADDAAS